MNQLLREALERLEEAGQGLPPKEEAAAGQWHERLASAWSAVSQLRRGDGRGSACHHYQVAARLYAEAGAQQDAARCRQFAEASAEQFEYETRRRAHAPR